MRDLPARGSIDIVEFKRHIYKSKPHLSPMAVSIFHTLDKVGLMAPTLPPNFLPEGHISIVLDDIPNWLQ